MDRLEHPTEIACALEVDQPVYGQFTVNMGGSSSLVLEMGSVGRAKQQIVRKTGMPTHLLHVWHAGKELLDDSAHVMSYGVENGSHLQLLIPVLGGVNVTDETTMLELFNTFEFPPQENKQMLITNLGLNGYNKVRHLRENEEWHEVKMMLMTRARIKKAIGTPSSSASLPPQQGPKRRLDHPFQRITKKKQPRLNDAVNSADDFFTDVLFVRNVVPWQIPVKLAYSVVEGETKDDRRLHSGRFYVRKAVRDLFTQLNSASRQDEEESNWTFTPVISGSPGTGKTSAVWLWSRSHDENGVLFRRTDDKSTSLFYLLGGVVSRLPQGTLVEDCPFGAFLVLDGVTRDTYGDAVGSLDAWHCKRKFEGFPRAMIVMSQGASVSKPESMRAVGRREIVLDPWLWQEMVDVGNDELFIKQHYSTMASGSTLPSSLPHIDEDDERKTRWSKMYLDALRWKKRWAGVSARYMYYMDKKSVVESLNDAISKCVDMASLQTLAVGDKAASSVNRLVVRRSFAAGYQLELLSPFVIEQLLLKDKKNAFLNHLEATAKKTKNMAFFGWVFEARLSRYIEVKGQVKSEILLIVPADADQTDTKTEIHFSVDFLKNYKTRNEITAAISSVKERFDANTQFPLTLWLIPHGINQGCFDFACVRFTSASTADVFTWQATVANDHSMKLEFVAMFVQDVVSAGITVTKQYLYALVPNEEALNSFKWSHNIKTWGKQTRYNDNTMIEIEINKAFPPNL